MSELSLKSSRIEQKQEETIAKIASERDVPKQQNPLPAFVPSPVIFITVVHSLSVCSGSEESVVTNFPLLKD